ncbi:MAG: MBL fold metallo-hydrolase [Pyrinomonadaceae bacterium]
MIKAVRKDDEFLADVEQARKERGKLHLWWLGQAGFLVQWQGHHLLLDPYLSDSLTAKYASTATPHVRMSERVIDPRRLDFIDVVSSSHNHTDHLDHETLWPLREANLICDSSFRKRTAPLWQTACSAIRPGRSAAMTAAAFKSARSR